MQRLIAIDCDSREVAFVTAMAAGDRITLESGGVLPLKPADGDVPLTPDQVGKQLQSLIGKVKKAGAKVLVSVDRNSTELFTITVPPAAEAELPEMVLNQLSVDSPNIVEESIVDFVVNPGPTDDARRISATALSKKEFDRLTAICSAAGLTPARMLSRSYETAALFLKLQPNTSGDSLLVNVIADEVDLIVVDRTRPLFFRTVKLPGILGDEATDQRLLDEIRRTLLVVPQNPEVGQVIESVFVFGTGPNQRRIVEQMANDTVKTQTFDPYAGFTFGSQWNEPSSSRLIPLLGMLVSEANSGKHAVDFANPRRAPIPPNRTRQIVMVAVAILAFGGSGVYYLWETFSKLDAEIVKLKNDSAKLKTQIKKTSEKKNVTDAIEDWNASSIIWLDELRDLASKFPSGQDFVIQRLTMTPSRSGRATIAFQGLASESRIVTRMESALRDARHEVQTPRVEERTQDKLYSWSFDASISLSPAKLDIERMFGKTDEKKSDSDDSEDEPEPSPKETKTKSKSRTKAPTKPTKKETVKKEADEKDSTEKEASNEKPPYDDQPKSDKSEPQEQEEKRK